MMDDNEASDTTPLSHQTELDSHVNMPVVGCNAYVFSDSGQTASVSPYNPDYPSNEIPIVDAAVLCTDSYRGTEYILVI